MFPDVYSIFPHLPNLNESYLEEARSSNFVRPFVDETPMFPYTSKTKSSFENTKFIKDLAKHFGHARAYYLKNDPQSCYHWHTDLKRKTAINFLLNDVGNAVTFFKGEDDGRYSSIVKVPYELYRPTVLDSSILHTVFNYSDEIRYILSVGFEVGVTYAHLCDFLNNYQTTDY